MPQRTTNPRQRTSTTTEANQVDPTPRRTRTATDTFGLPNTSTHPVDMIQTAPADARRRGPNGSPLRLDPTDYAKFVRRIRRRYGGGTMANFVGTERKAEKSFDELLCLHPRQMRQALADLNESDVLKVMLKELPDAIYETRQEELLRLYGAAPTDVLMRRAKKLVSKPMRGQVTRQHAERALQVLAALPEEARDAFIAYQDGRALERLFDAYDLTIDDVIEDQRVEEASRDEATDTQDGSRRRAPRIVRLASSMADAAGHVAQLGLKVGTALLAPVRSAGSLFTKSGRMQASTYGGAAWKGLRLWGGGTTTHDLERFQELAGGDFGGLKLAKSTTKHTNELEVTPNYKQGSIETSLKRLEVERFIAPDGSVSTGRGLIHDMKARFVWPTETSKDQGLHLVLDRLDLEDIEVHLDDGPIRIGRIQCHGLVADVDKPAHRLSPPKGRIAALKLLQTQLKEFIAIVVSRLSVLADPSLEPDEIGARIAQITGGVDGARLKFTSIEVDDVRFDPEFSHSGTAPGVTVVEDGDEAAVSGPAQQTDNTERTDSDTSPSRRRVEPFMLAHAEVKGASVELLHAPLIEELARERATITGSEFIEPPHRGGPPVSSEGTPLPSIRELSAEDRRRVLDIDTEATRLNKLMAELHELRRLEAKERLAPSQRHRLIELEQGLHSGAAKGFIDRIAVDGLVWGDKHMGAFELDRASLEAIGEDLRLPKASRAQQLAARIVHVVPGAARRQVPKTRSVHRGIRIQTLHAKDVNAGEDWGQVQQMRIANLFGQTDHVSRIHGGFHSLHAEAPDIRIAAPPEAQNSRYPGRWDERIKANQLLARGGRFHTGDLTRPFTLDASMQSLTTRDLDIHVREIMDLHIPSAQAIGAGARWANRRLEITSRHTRAKRPDLALVDTGRILAERGQVESLGVAIDIPEDPEAWYGWNVTGEEARLHQVGGKIGPLDWEVDPQVQEPAYEESMFDWSTTSAAALSRANGSAKVRIPFQFAMLGMPLEPRWAELTLHVKQGAVGLADIDFAWSGGLGPIATFVRDWGIYVGKDGSLKLGLEAAGTGLTLLTAEAMSGALRPENGGALSLRPLLEGLTRSGDGQGTAAPENNTPVEVQRADLDAMMNLSKVPTLYEASSMVLSDVFQGIHAAVDTATSAVSAVAQALFVPSIDWSVTRDQMDVQTHDLRLGDGYLGPKGLRVNLKSLNPGDNNLDIGMTLGEGIGVRSAYLVGHNLDMPYTMADDAQLLGAQMTLDKPLTDGWKLAFQANSAHTRNLLVDDGITAPVGNARPRHRRL